MDVLKDLVLKLFESLNFNVELSNLLASLIMIAILVLIGILATKIFKQILFKMFKIKKYGARALTVAKLTSSISKYVIWFLIITLILSELNIDLTPFIATAGVIGIALGFGAQEVVKDFFSGFFIIVEDSFNVGDVVQVKDFKGKVIELGLRTTKLINWVGDINIVRNGEISNIINFSKENSMAVVDFGVSYGTNLENFPQFMEEFVSSIDGKYENMITKPRYLGVTELDDSSINMRIIASTKPNEHYQIERDIRSELVLFLKGKNIEIPFPQVVVHNG